MPKYRFSFQIREKQHLVIKAVILPEVADWFLKLADTLYDQGYFGFGENAVTCVRELFEDIRDNTNAETVYFVRYVNNNHKIAQCL
jgi:hypothetical protein